MDNRLAGDQEQRSSFLSSSNGLYEDEDFDENSSDDDYLEDGEPYGSCLMPTENPYDRRARVEELNSDLEKSKPGKRKVPTKVVIREDRNRYVTYDESGDDPRLPPSRKRSSPDSYNSSIPPDEYSSSQSLLNSSSNTLDQEEESGQQQQRTSKKDLKWKQL